MIKLIATPASHIDDRTIAFRQQHHLTAGWLPCQSWKIDGENEDGQNVEGDAQVLVVGRVEDCVAVVRFGSSIVAVACFGIIQGLERLGYERKNVKVI